jgi:hypothetical protein
MTSQFQAQLLNEGPLGLAAAARLVPSFRGGKSTAPSTVFRWISEGCRGAGGERIKLEAARIGGRWITSQAALDRFVAALTAAHSTESSTEARLPRSPGARRSASHEAAKALEDAGA